MNRFEIGSTPEEVAKTLRNLAETTAKFSQNWDAYEDILRDVFKQVYNHVQSSCPGHVASAFDPKICGRCGTHIDSLRPE